MHSIKLIKTLNIIPIKSQHYIGRYVALLVGAGLTTASFLVSGGTLAILGSGIMCGAGLKLLKEITKNSENNSCNKSIYDISLGALNGLISSIGIVCITQNQCNTIENIHVTETQQLLTYYALSGLITGTINGTINEVINLQQSHNYRIGYINNIKSNDSYNDNIKLLNIGKSSFMEMGSNMITAIGKSTLFKSANYTPHINMNNIYSTSLFNSNRDIFTQNIHRISYDKMKRYGRSFSNILAIRKSQTQKQNN
eukprot:117224_1